MSKKVIVTGATGQIGSYMIDYLVENTDHQILCGVRRTSQFINSHIKQHENNKRVKVVHFDLCDVHSITALIKNEKPDYFINLGAQTFVADSWSSPSLHFQTNAESLIHILESVRNHVPNCRVYSSGSSEQFGNVEYSPQDINHPFKPRSPYGASKAAAHNIAKVWRESYGLYVVQGVLFNNESPRRQEYFVTRKISKGVARINEELLYKKPKPLELGNLDAKRDWSDSEDFVKGIWLMLNQERGEEKDYVLASGETHSIRDFVEQAFKVADLEGRWEGEGVNEKYICKFGNSEFEAVLINPDFYRPAEVELLLGDSTPARKELGWEPKTSFNKLVEKMVVNDLKQYNE